jgi:hypothetical protein
MLNISKQIHIKRDRTKIYWPTQKYLNMSFLALAASSYKFKGKEQRSQGIALLNPGDAEEVLFDNLEEQIINIRILSDRDSSVPKTSGRSYICTENFDVYESFMLHTNIGLEHISNVELFSNGNPIVECSGATLLAVQTLSGTIDIPRGMVMLPFPKVNAYKIRDLWIRITYTMTRKKNAAIQVRATSDIAAFFPKSLASIVSSYLGGSLMGYISIYGMYYCFDIPNEPEHSMLAENVEITQFQTHIEQISASEHRVRVNLHFTDSTRRYLIYFVNPDDPMCPLDVLRSGKLELNRQVIHSKFTGRMLLYADKFMTGTPIPEMPIYTLTFDPQKDVMKSDTSSILNSTKIDYILLEVDIEPQKTALSMIVIAEGYNILRYHLGGVTVVYCY